MLTYARHVQAGRFPYHPHQPQQHRAAAGAAGRRRRARPRSPTRSDAASGARRSSARRTPAYQTLKAELAELRGKTAATARKEIADGPVLKLRAQEPDGRCARADAARAARSRGRRIRPASYDAKLAEAVKKFQKAQRPAGDRQARSRRPSSELNGPATSQQIDIILANMERWRWYPRDLGKAYVDGQHPGLHAAR